MRALRVLADANGLTKGPALADALDPTVGFVPQVVGPLVKAGWVRSEPGPTGGYLLTADLADVSVVADRPCGGTSPCVLHDASAAGRSDLVRSLDGMALR